MYHWLRQPFKTQRAIRRGVRGLYDASPSGYPGNDDLGGALLGNLFAALGLYPEVPGVGLFALTSPLFPHATLHLPGGDVVIDASRAAPDDPYASSPEAERQALSQAVAPVLLDRQRRPAALQAEWDPEAGLGLQSIGHAALVQGRHAVPIRRMRILNRERLRTRTAAHLVDTAAHSFQPTSRRIQ